MCSQIWSRREWDRQNLLQEMRPTGAQAMAGDGAVMKHDEVDGQRADGPPLGCRNVLCTKGVHADSVGASSPTTFAVHSSSAAVRRAKRSIMCRCVMTYYICEFYFWTPCTAALHMRETCCLDHETDGCGSAARSVGLPHFTEVRFQTSMQVVAVHVFCYACYKVFGHACTSVVSAHCATRKTCE